MTYSLAIGNYAYSSWSLRGWLLFHRFGIPFERTTVDFGASASIEAQLAGFSPARTVPAFLTETGAVISESLAIAEHLAENHPNAGIWPKNPYRRAIARNLAAEMHAGFSALREFCPMNLHTAYHGVDIPDAVHADLERLELIWRTARATAESHSPWLCGEYCAADVFYAPIAARIAGYTLKVSDDSQAYVTAHLDDKAFRRWRAMAIASGKTLDRYARSFPTRQWPGPKPIHAVAIEAETSENANCPYSGRPATHFLEMGGRVFGFCNAFCRDKTVADPEAWPAFMALVDPVEIPVTR